MDPKDKAAAYQEIKRPMGKQKTTVDEYNGSLTNGETEAMLSTVAGEESLTTPPVIELPL